jgi:DNA-binding transcriptional ArsR family regulator
MPEPPARVRTVESLKALTHPLRRRILRQLGSNGPATSTTLAAVFGENTGTISYHLRQLERYGYIEDVPGHGNGRERWWRQASVDWRSPDPENFNEADRAVLEDFAVRKLTRDLQEIGSFLDDWYQSKEWRQWSRAGTYLTKEQLAAFFDEYMTLVNRYTRSIEDAPPGARAINVRLFAYPTPDHPDD